VAVNNCNPPTHTLTIAKPLEPLPEDGMTMLEAINQWQEDVAERNNLADRHNVLVNWVLESC